MDSGKMTKYGLANEKHEHGPLELACSLLDGRRTCGKAHVCCYFCDNQLHCPTGNPCTMAWFSMKYQPKPSPFYCRNAKSVPEITWDLIFNGTDTY